MIPQGVALSILLGGLGGMVARWVAEEVRLSRLVREKLGPYRGGP